MVRRTKTFDIEYNYFEPGTIVTPIDGRGELEHRRHYRVIQCMEPELSDYVCTCYVEDVIEGVFMSNSVMTEYLREVDNG